MLSNLNARIVHALLAAAAVIIFLLGFLVVGDVIGRALFNAPIKGTSEMVSMSIVIICFLLAGYSVHSGSMIQADILVSAFGNRGRAFAQLASATLGILFFGLIVWGSFGPAAHSWFGGAFEGEDAMRVLAWPARVIILFGSALVIITYVEIGVGAMGRLISGEAESDPRPHLPL